MPERKLYNVVLVQGFSYTDSTGRTFYQNRPANLELTDAEADALRQMEGGQKFRLSPVTEKPRKAPEPPPIVPEDGDDPEDGGDDSGASGADSGDSDGEPEDPDDDGDEADPFDDEDDGDDEPEDFDGMTVSELKSYLDGAGVDYPSNARKDDLIQLAKITAG